MTLLFAFPAVLLRQRGSGDGLGRWRRAFRAQRLTGLAGDLAAGGFRVGHGSGSLISILEAKTSTTRG